MRISDWSSDVCSSDLIVGSGAAGLAAAMAAANAGKQVLLVEADAELGGGLLSERAEVEGLTPAAWRDRMLAALSAMPNVTVMNRTMALDRKSTRLNSSH